MPDMPSRPVPPQHLNRQPGRHKNGKVYWYVRIGKGARIPIPGEYGTPGFWEAYRAALAGGRVSSPPPVRASRGTLQWAVDLWKRSSDWGKTSVATRRQRDNILLHILAKSGARALEEITAADIRAGREKRQATPHAANNFLKTMRAFFRWAKEEQLVDADPAAGVKFIPVKTNGWEPWNMAEVEAYRARWPLGTNQRMLLEIYINTGFRRGDATTAGWQHVRDGVIHMRTGKTDTPIYIPILPALSAALDAMPKRRALTFMLSRGDRPYTKESLGNLFREWCDAAGINKSAHGIRKLAATAIADNGASEQELQALFGWTTGTMSGLYTRERDRRRQSLQAAFRLLEELEKTGTKSPNPLAKAAQPINKIK
jgi:integrase